MAQTAEAPFNDNNSLQPFFVLHRRPKTRRRIDLSNANQTTTSTLDTKIDTFNHVWSKIDLSIKDVLRKFNTSLFGDVSSWVHESFQAAKPLCLQATQPYPLMADALSRQIFAGLIYTKNMEFVDDQLTFDDLGTHLKSHGCLVANLSSMDFSAKNGIGGCLTRLSRQFLMESLDAADMSILASWYSRQKKRKPMVVIIEDIERCCGSVLSDFIMMLSEWVVKIPVVLIMGVATTLDAPRNVLSSNALQRLCCRKFLLGSPAKRMDAIIEAVFLRPCLRFSVGHKVALFMRDYFLKHDGTLTSFIRALKIACMQHLCVEPLSFMLKDVDNVADLERIWSGDQISEQDFMLKHSSRHPSYSTNSSEHTRGSIVNALAKLGKFCQGWATVIMCLHEAGKAQKVQLLDLYCEALGPLAHESVPFCDKAPLTSSGCSSGHQAASQKRVSIGTAVRKVRELPPAALSELLRRWGALTDDLCEVHEKVKELHSMLKFADGKNSEYDLTDISLRRSSRGISIAKDQKLLNEKAVALIEWMLREYLLPIEDMPFHEVFCFKDINRLQKALLGDPRKTIQSDLLGFQKYMCCRCCSNRESKLLPSLHDTTIMYILAQEHCDVINVHDWYQSFKATVTHSKGRSKLSPSPKKRKVIDPSHGNNEAAIQARFCRAVSELQITGLLRMPSKRRPDYVHRVAFGL